MHPLLPLRPQHSTASSKSQLLLKAHIFAKASFLVFLINHYVQKDQLLPLPLEPQVGQIRIILKFSTFRLVCLRTEQC